MPDSARARRPESLDRGRRHRPSLGLLMACVAGIAVSIWVMFGNDRDVDLQHPEIWFVIFSTALGGLSFVGPPLLLLERWRGDRGRWGPGRLLWFSTGTAAWLLWPPIVIRRSATTQVADSSASICFAYGTPLMALYVVFALVAGGLLGRRGRSRLRRSWQESFGLVIGLLWACTGLYVLSRIYLDKLR